MTLKQAFIRYLKNVNLYGELYNYIYYQTGSNYLRCIRSLRRCTVMDLFYVVAEMKRQKTGRNWYYENKTLYDFIRDWCVNDISIKRGDLITCKTLDGKYEFTYKVEDVWLSKMEVEVENYQYIKMERICKINNKECDFVNSWALKNK